MLKEKFDGAHEVKQKRRSGRRMLVPKYHRFKHHGDIDLVYLVTSPDYCELDVKKGSLGTKGRECNPVSSSPILTPLSSHPIFSCCRSRKASTGATCCVATAATQREESDGRRGASASSTGAATWSARSAWGTCRSPPATETKHQPPWSGTHEHPSSGSWIFIQREKPCLFPIVSITLYSIQKNKHRPGGLKTWDGQKPQPAEADPFEKQMLERRPTNPIQTDRQYEEKVFSK